MELTRRSFLALTAATPWALPSHVDLARTGCVVVRTAHECLQESSTGYLQWVGGASMSTDTLSAERAATWIVPAGAIDRALAGRLREAAWSGTSVLIELGVAFQDAPRARIQRRVLSHTFDIAIGDATHVWAEQRARVPYVKYGWPVSVWVRDFSRMVALGGPGWKAIAQMESQPVAVHRRVGRGAVTVLGSPLGPALRAGDREAVAWLRAFVAGDAPIHAQNG